MENYVVTLRLIDGSTHDAVITEESVHDVVKFVDEKVQKNELINAKDSKYGEIFGKNYIYGKNIISFHISSLNADGKGIKG